MLHTDSLLFHAIVSASQDPDPYRAMRFTPFAPTARLRSASFLAKANLVPVRRTGFGTGLLRPLQSGVEQLTIAFQSLLPKRAVAAGACCTTPGC